jgi:phosphogluconate dehydratase
MCDGVTQGQPGMDLSLFSRDTIALSTAIALSHGMFEAAALLGICDKIVPGLLIGVLRFGHLPTILVPAGPMPSGLANKEKQRVRQLYAEGKAGREELLEAEAASYHSPGTCTFYGTANSNQMMMEVMGLHVPGAAFVNPGTPLRQQLTRAAVHRLAEIGSAGNDYRPLGHCVDEKAIVNAAVGLLATGGSTNHAIHLPAIARAAGILFDWEDLDRLSAAVPLIARIYPNGSGDVNHFHAAGGMGFVIRTLLDEGLLHGDLLTVSRGGMADYTREPVLNGSEGPAWQDAPAAPLDPTMLRPASDPFQPDGGMRLVSGNLGRGTIKTSAVDPSRWTIEAPARIFSDQNSVLAAFKAGKLDRDVVVVVRFQGPRANGMPELHKLTLARRAPGPRLPRRSGHRRPHVRALRARFPPPSTCLPEALGGGPLRRCATATSSASRRERASSRPCPTGRWDGARPRPAPPPPLGTGRELFAFMRTGADSAERGARPCSPRWKRRCERDRRRRHRRHPCPFALAEVQGGRR